MAREFDVSYQDSTQTFQFWPLPDDDTSAINCLKRNIEQILSRDIMMGRGDKRMEWHPTRVAFRWDEELGRMHGSHYGSTIKIIFTVREEAAKFKLLYCADGKFISKDRVF